jgi:predicted DNA-binding protein with PD1-like motif
LRTRKMEGGFLLRLDPGEEVVSSLADFCAREKIGFASISGIGAAGSAMLAVFDTKTKRYTERDLDGELELVSLAGNATMEGGKPKIHLHACIADRSLAAHGGHLMWARISVTCELVLAVFGSQVERRKDDATGLSLLDI